MRGSIHKNGMTATSCDIWLVTDNKNKEAVALRAIHNDIKAKEGRSAGVTESTKSTSIMKKDMADRPSAGPSETVVQLGSPCPLCSSPNSWWVLKTEY